MRPDRRKDRPIRHDKFRDLPSGPPPPREFLFGMVAAAAAAHGLEILDLSLSFGGTFRVVLDKDDPGGVGSEDLTRFLFEVRDRIRDAGHDPGDLRIELDSPGERRLLTTARHFERFTGRRVRAYFRTPQDGKEHVVGNLLGHEEGRARVQDGDGVVHLLDPAVVKSIHLEP